MSFLATRETPPSLSRCRSPSHDPESRAASFFGALCFALLLIGALVAVSALSGCDRPLTRGETTQQIAYCKAHHQLPVAFASLHHPDKTYAIQCVVER